MPCRSGSIGSTFAPVRNASVAGPPLSATDRPRNGVAAEPGTSNAMTTDSPRYSSSISRSGPGGARDERPDARRRGVFAAQVVHQQAHVSGGLRLPVLRGADEVHLVAVTAQNPRRHIHQSEMADDDDASAPTGMSGVPVLCADHPGAFEQPRPPIEFAQASDLRHVAPRQRSRLGCAWGMEEQVGHQALGALALDVLPLDPVGIPDHRRDRQRDRRRHQPVEMLGGIKARQPAASRAIPHGERSVIVEDWLDVLRRRLDVLRGRWECLIHERRG